MKRINKYKKIVKYKNNGLWENLNKRTYIELIVYNILLFPLLMIIYYIWGFTELLNTRKVYLKEIK